MAEQSIKKVATQAEPVDISDGQVIDKIDSEQGNMDKQTLEALQDYQPDSDLEKKLVRKVDLLLIPTLWFMCVLCFMDRSNIGNANAAGMSEDLGISETQYPMLITIFFIAYFIWEVPSNLILTRCPRPSLYLSALMLIWGAIVVVMSEMQNYTHALVCRFFLAIIEAGFPPGVLYIMTTWYKKSEIGKRWSLFYTAICFSGAASGLISGAVISGLEGALGRRGWRWLFIIEGIVTMVFAIFAAAVLPDYPQTPSKRFSEEERRLAVARMMHDRAESGPPRRKLTAAQSVLAAVCDVRLYLFILVFILQNGSATVSYFIPTVLGSMGYSGVAQQWMTVPVWVTGVVFLIIFSFLSDRVRNRHWFVVGALSMALISAIICNFVQVDIVRYVFLCFYIAGLYTTYPLVLNWASETMSQPAEKRAVVIALVNAAGSLSSTYGGYIWPKSDAPTYKTGFTTVSCFIGIALLAAISLPWLAKYVPKNTTKAERELEALD